MPLNSNTLFIFFIILLISCGSEKNSKTNTLQDTLNNNEKLIEYSNICDCLELMETENGWTYRDSLYTGHCISYYKNGNKQSEADFDSGKIAGVFKTYYENGSPEEIITYKNGEPDGEVVRYYQNKMIKEKGLVVENKKEGKWEVYYENGLLMLIENYKSNKLEDSTFSYFKNGNIEYKGKYMNGLAEGKWTFYDSISGKIDGYLIYKNDKPVQHINPQ